MKRMVILRGPSGSGKSTIARTFGVQHYETDDFWCQTGSYVFEPSQLGAAHKWNQDRVRAACMAEDELIVVANTNMSRWEMNPYLQMAREFGYEIDVVRTPGPWEASELFERNVHGVPMASLEKQIRKYEAVDGEREWEDMAVFSNE